jgi:hypothetical protein
VSALGRERLLERSSFEWHGAQSPYGDDANVAILNDENRSAGARVDPRAGGGGRELAMRPLTTRSSL